MAEGVSGCSKRIIGQETRTILVDVNHILGATDRAAVAIGGIVVATVELVQDQGRAVTADVLDLGQLLMRDKVTRRVSGVRGQQYLSATGNLLGDLVGVDVIVVLLGQRDGYGGNLPRHGSAYFLAYVSGLHTDSSLQVQATHVLEQRQHLRVRRVIGNGE